MSEPFIRKFPRVHLQKSLTEVFKELEAHVVWPNLEISDVVDLSYKGLAARKPALHTVSTGSRLPLEVVLGRNERFSVQSKVVWQTPDAIGFEIDSLSADSHRALAKYMDPNLLGSTLRPVDKSFFASGQSFDYWFQGPQGAHVLIWLKEGRAIDRVQVDLDGQSTEFFADQPRRLPTAQEQQALLLLSQIDQSQVAMDEFLRHLGG